MNIHTKQAGFAHIWLLAVAVILGIGGAGYYVWQQQEETQKTTNSSPVDPDSSQTSQTLKPNQVTEEIKNTLAKQYELLDLDTDNQPQAGELSVRLENVSPAYRVDGYNFYANYDGGSALYALASTYNSQINYDYSNEKAVRKTIVASYKDQGLVYTATVGDVEYATAIDYYEGKGLVCTIESPETQSSGVTASCGELEAYTKAAPTVAEFVRLITKDGQDTSTLYIGYPTIEDSETPGYKKATAGVGDISEGGGYSALFYKNGDEPWKFFMGTQEGIACSEYNTQELRNAYKGDQCYKDADATIGTVQ